MLTLILKKRSEDGTVISKGRLSGFIEIKASGTIDGVVSKHTNSLELCSTRQQSHDAWYSTFCQAKLNAMRFGGRIYLDDNTYYEEDSDLLTFGDSSDDTLDAIRSGKYVRTIQGEEPAPDTGNICINGGKTLTVSTALDKTVGELSLRLPTHHYYANKLIQELDRMTMRLYHCYNSLAGRLQVFDPAIPVDGISQISTMGKYLGTYLNYQAVVCRWNTYAWANSFTLDVVEAGERVAIAVGYLNLNCTENSQVTYRLIVQPSEPSETLETALTLFDQGTDSTIASGTPVKTVFLRNGKRVSGTGYEGKNPDLMVSLEVNTVINPEDADNKISMKAEQYHRNIISIAPCSGVDKEYDVQSRDDELAKMPLTLTCEWTINGITTTKTATCNIVTVGYVKEEDNDTQ